MRNIFKRKQNEEVLKVEIFKDWTELEEAKLQEEIKKQKTEDLKELLSIIKASTILSIGITAICMIVSELLDRD